MKTKRLLTILALSSLIALPVTAEILIAQDNFTYSNGSVAGLNGGSGWGGAWTGSTVASVSNSALSITGDNNNAATRNLSTTISSDVIIRFDFTFTGTLQNNDFLGLWFGSTTGPNIGLKANCGTAAGGCIDDLFARTSGSDAGGHFQDVAAATTYSLMGYLQKTGASTKYNRFDFWVDPTAEEIATLTNADAFDTGDSNISAFSTIGFRSVNIDTGDTLTIDNLRINQVPEPGTLALLGLALAGMAGFSSRRRNG